jgi:hypothetical protein
MERFIVIHYHELGLKGGNRDYLEPALQKYHATCGFQQADTTGGRILLN